MAKNMPRENDGTEINPDQIARCAYEIWESEGRPEGRAAQHWFEAEARLRLIPMQAGESEKPPRAKKTPARKSGVQPAGKRFEMVT